MSFASAGHTNLQPRPSTPMSLQLLFLASSSITCTQSAEDGSPIPTQVLPSCTFTITPLLTKVKFTDWPITYLHTHCPPPPALPPPSEILQQIAQETCFLLLLSYYSRDQLFPKCSDSLWIYYAGGIITYLFGFVEKETHQSNNLLSPTTEVSNEQKNLNYKRALVSLFKSDIDHMRAQILLTFYQCLDACFAPFYVKARKA